MNTVDSADTKIIMSICTAVAFVYTQYNVTTSDKYVVHNLLVVGLSCNIPHGPFRMFFNDSAHLYLAPRL